MQEDRGNALHEFTFDQIANLDRVLLKTDGRLDGAQFEPLLLKAELQFEIL